MARRGGREGWNEWIFGVKRMDRAVCSFMVHAWLKEKMEEKRARERVRTSRRQEDLCTAHNIFLTSACVTQSET